MRYSLLLTHLFCGHPENDEELMSRVEDDLEVVRLEAAHRARSQLGKGDVFRPFAITLTAENELLSHEVSPEAAEGPSTALEILAYGVRSGVAGSNPRAVALVRSVVVRELLGEGEVQAVCVALEHQEGKALRCFLPYKRVEGVVSWGRERLVPAVPWCFGSGSERG
jgi:hypothetical protein